MNAPLPPSTLPPSTWLRRRAGSIFHRIVDRVDAGLVTGQIDVFLPDGSFRILGGRGVGPSCTVVIRRWRALIRLAHSGSVGWYEGWAAGDWSSPDIVALFEIFARNRATLKQTARPKGFSRIAKRIRHALNSNDHAGAARNIVAHA
jgi:cyclopropane-fatty-acyl-phospholipid synthase